MDDKFNDFVTNKAFGIGLVSKATSADLTDLNQVQKSVDAYEKSAIKLAEKAEELQKQIAKKNEEDIYGRITDPTEISKIENYRKAHPKS